MKTANTPGHLPHSQLVKPGIDVLLEQPEVLAGKRIGVVCNQASVTTGLKPTLDALIGCDSFSVTVVFSPEHGLFGEWQDQVGVSSWFDSKRGILVESLYGKRLWPSEESLRQIDAIVFDLQDVGARYYTFIWTMVHCMRACRAHQKMFVVLDRPNPIGGLVLEGNLLDPGFSSFVGMLPIPVRHAMTVGELAMLFNSEHRIGCKLEVIQMQGWHREMFFDRTGLVWVPPSPNMPTPDTALVYPGTCLLEGTNISEGRGTTKPFELFGAPFVDPDTLCETLNGIGLPGVSFRPASFRPMFSKHTGKLCNGAQLHVTDRSSFKPYLTGLAVIKSAYELWPSAFEWRRPPYEFEKEKLPFDLLTGTSQIRQKIEAGASLEEIEAAWAAELRSFAKLRLDYLIY